jgi:hypothetical protein
MVAAPTARPGYDESVQRDGVVRLVATGSDVTILCATLYITPCKIALDEAEAVVLITRRDL